MNKQILAGCVLCLLLSTRAYATVSITQYPQSSNVCPGSSVTLSVSANCYLFCLSYQWYYEDPTFPGFALEITGATSHTLTVYYSDFSGTSRRYKVKVSDNLSNSVTTGWVTVTKIGNPYIPSGITVGQESTCPGSQVQLLAEGSLPTGSSWAWYSGSCGGTQFPGSGSGLLVYPTETTTYYLRQESDCGVSACVEETVVVSEYSTAATGITPAKSAVCPREETSLGVDGGSLGTGAQWAWYGDACQGTLLGFGSSVSVSQDAATTYYVRAEGVCDTTTCASLTLSMETTPDPPGTEDLLLCEGETASLTATGTSITWYADAGLTTQLAASATYQPAITETGTYKYYVTQTGTNCESNPDSVSVSIYGIPAKPAADDRYGCIGGVIPNLTATGTNLTWYTDPQLLNAVNTGNTYITGKDQVGTYTWYLTQTVNNCESPTDTVKLLIHNTPSKPSATDKTICFGVTGTQLSAGGTDIRWYSDPVLSGLVYNGAVFTPDESIAGTHKWYVTQTVDHCESAADTAILVIKDQVETPDGVDAAICSGETVPALTVSGTNVTWYADEGLDILVHSGNSFTPGVTETGTYRWYVVNEVNDCLSAVDSMSLKIIAYPDAPLCSDTEICHGEAVPNLTATGSDVKWFSDQGLTTLVHMGNTFISGKTNIGSYKWYVIQSSGKCNSSTSLARLAIMAVPAANAIEDSEICEGESIDIGSFSVDGHSYAWREEGSAEVFSAVSNPQVMPDATTTFLLTVTLDSTGCTDDNSVTITVHPAPELSMVFEKNPIHEGEGTTITAAGAASYIWSPADGLSATTGSQVTASPLSDTQITLSGISGEGCEGASVSEMLYVSCGLCGDITMFDPHGTFNHGCTDHGYDNMASCSWTIIPTGTVEHIYLFFHPDSFDIRPGDWLRIYNGSDEQGELVAEYNNAMPPPASLSVQAGASVFIRFTSDGSGTGRGFQARYDVMPNLIRDLTAEEISIYPNPVREVLYLNAVREMPGKADLYIYNSTGRLVLTGSYEAFRNGQINVTGLAPGVYQVRLVAGRTILRGNFMKQ